MNDTTDDGAGTEQKAGRLLKVREVCERLSLSSPYVYQLMESGELPYVKFGKARRVEPADVEDLIARKKVQRSG